MGARPYVDGFRLDGPVKPGTDRSMAVAAVNIARGDILIDNGSGYLTNAAITAFVDGAVYVALEPCNNSAGSAGDLNCIVASANDPTNLWWVPNESATVAAQTDVGEVVDLESEDGIDVTDTTNVAIGFAIEEIDISAAAIAAKAGGFVKGRFITVGETT